MSKAFDNAMRLSRLSAKIRHNQSHSQPHMAAKAKRELQKELRKHKLKVK